ncbi:Ku protein [Aureibacillus halotolerans]|uniref:Non-homologous end joining protein Ku n=1 Tax=Aureibacillus halotolerans TaxID=1508390 RepID=A0A4R6UEG8_9BACI|nr:Ku protein [Aureibacillus halotolerans]TDQ41484.1 DNA end-binding protein Ku [Aureibacillus halotolerans]
MHTVWKGAISFGLVNIPIKLYKATETSGVPLRQLHKTCHTPIQYKKFCPQCEVDVDKDDIEKGYEFEKDSFVPVDETMLQKEKGNDTSKTADIQQFVSLKDIDPIYFDASYFIGPDASGQKPYALLFEALKATSKAGIAIITIRQKEHLALIRSYDAGLLMETMHFPEAIRSVDSVPNMPKKVDIQPKEQKTAEALIDQLSTTWNPEEYSNTAEEALLDRIAKQASAIKAPSKASTKGSSMDDLMKTLQASIDQSKPAKQKQKKQRTSEKVTKDKGSKKAK